MKNFVSSTGKDGITRWINLRAVSNINVLGDKVVLNMAFTYTDKHQGLMSLAHFLNPSNFYEIAKAKRFEKDFVKVEGEDRLVYVNKNYVSSVSLELGKNLKRDKLIICFRNSVSKKFPNNTEKIVPEYMYVSLSPNTDPEKAFEKFINELDKE